MHESVLGSETLKTLIRLTKVTSRRKFYLGGGTGCALHLGHRVSQDLDFFSQESFEPAEIQRELQTIGETAADYTDGGTWVGSVEATKVGFFYYRFPLMGPIQIFRDAAVASLEDIGCMKIEAIAGRGKKRDFVDLYFILKRTETSLASIFELFQKKYGRSQGNRYHILKSLTYFADAESDPDPRMLLDYSWADLKSFLAAQVKNITLI